MLIQLMQVMRMLELLLVEVNTYYSMSIHQSESLFSLMDDSVDYMGTTMNHWMTREQFSCVFPRKMNNPLKKKKKNESLKNEFT